MTYGDSDLGRAGLKPLLSAWKSCGLALTNGVGFNRLSCTEEGIYPRRILFRRASNPKGAFKRLVEGLNSLKG